MVHVEEQSSCSRSRSRRSRSLSSMSRATAGVSLDRQGDCSPSRSRGRPSVKGRVRKLLKGAGSGSATATGVPPARNRGRGSGQRRNRPRQWRPDGARGERRLARTARFRVEVAAGGRTYLPGLDDNLGPVRMRNICGECAGQNQFSFSCQAAKNMCGGCCREARGGPCSFHTPPTRG